MFRLSRPGRPQQTPPNRSEAMETHTRLVIRPLRSAGLLPAPAAAADLPQLPQLSDTAAGGLAVPVGPTSVGGQRQTRVAAALKPALSPGHRGKLDQPY